MDSRRLLLLIIFSTILTTTVNSQEINNTPEAERPYRIGLKIGYPNLVGGNAEYMLPIFNRKFGVSIDYSRLRSENLFSAGGVNEEGTEDLDLNMRYIEAGINYYFFKPGKGLYAAASYGSFNFKSSEDNEEIDFSNGSLNLKIGARWGGLIYFRPEVGYAFSPVPETIDKTVYNEDGSSQIEQEDLNVSDYLDPIFSGLIFNIGIGIAF